MYGTADGFVTYFTERNKDVTPYDDAEINAALIVASEWIDGVYGSTFVGRKTGGFLQENEWPRVNATVFDGEGDFANYYTFPDNTVPTEVIRATYEAAFRQLVSPGTLNPDYTPNKYKRVAIDGAISVEYTQFSNASETILSISNIDMLLYKLLDRSNAGAMSGLSGPSSRV